MKRLALLIGAPGLEGQPGFLPGVAHDIINYRNFLRSPTGGAWAEQEIAKIPLNPDVRQLLRFVGSTRVDYVFVVFSGHGAMREATGQQFVTVQSPYSTPLASLVPKARAGVVIVDACRVYQGDGMAGFLGEEYQQFPTNLSPTVAQRLFTQQVLACPPGWTTLFACQPNALSRDNYDGGNFSNTLLNATNAWVKNPSPTNCLLVTQAFAQTEYHLRRQRPFLQQPQIAHSVELSRHAQQLPFAFRLPQRMM